MDVKIDHGIQNTLSKFAEDFSDYYKAYKIKLYLEILNSNFVEPEIKQKTKKQLNKEIMLMMVYEEEYDEWYKENMF